MLYNNMGSKMTPSLISEGGPLRPPHGSHRIRYPMGGRVKQHQWQIGDLEEIGLLEMPQSGLGSMQ